MSADTDATSDDTCNVPCIITCGLNKYFTKDNAPVAAPAGPVIINPSPTKKPAGNIKIYSLFHHILSFCCFLFLFKCNNIDFIIFKVIEVCHLVQRFQYQLLIIYLD